MKKIISIIILIFFLTSNLAYGYDNRGVSGQAQKSHLRAQQAKNDGIAEAIGNALGASEANVAGREIGEISSQTLAAQDVKTQVPGTVSVEGKILRCVREIFGLSQKDFGRALQPDRPIPENRILKWENGREGVPRQVIQRTRELFNPKFKQLREEMGLSQKELARKINPAKPMTEEAISNLERGISVISDDKIVKMWRLYKSFKARRRLTLKRLRLALGVTMEKLGYMLNPEKPVLRATIHTWESGLSLVPKDIIPRVEALSRVRLKEIRENLGLSQQELAELLRSGKPFSVSTINSWETGDTMVPEYIIGELRRVSAVRTKQLRNILGVTQGEFGRLLSHPGSPILQNTVSRWESGRFFPPDDFSVKVKKAFSIRFKQLRNALCLSQQELGELLSPDDPTPQVTISQWETGRRTIPEEIIPEVRSLFAPRLKHLRGVLRISQPELSRLLNVHKLTIFNWETGRGHVPENIIQKVVSLFGIRLKELRDTLGVTSREFGEMLSPQDPIPYSTILNWESGRRPVPEDIMRKAVSLIKKRGNIIAAAAGGRTAANVEAGEGSAVGAKVIEGVSISILDCRFGRDILSDIEKQGWIGQLKQNHRGLKNIIISQAKKGRPASQEYDSVTGTLCVYISATKKPKALGQFRELLKLKTSEDIGKVQRFPAQEVPADMIRFAEIWRGEEDLFPAAFRRLHQEEIWERLKFLPLGSKVLELGIGEGNTLRFLNPSQRKMLVGLDRREDFLQALKAKYPEVATLHCDWKNIGVQDPSFDTCIGTNSMLYLLTREDLQQMLKEIDRVLRFTNGKKRISHIFYSPLMSEFWLKYWGNLGDISDIQAAIKNYFKALEEEFKSLGYDIEIRSVTISIERPISELNDVQKLFSQIYPPKDGQKPNAFVLDGLTLNNMRTERIEDIKEGHFSEVVNCYVLIAEKKQPTVSVSAAAAGEATPSTSLRVNSGSGVPSERSEPRDGASEANVAGSPDAALLDAIRQKVGEIAAVVVGENAGVVIEELTNHWGIEPDMIKIAVDDRDVELQKAMLQAEHPEVEIKFLTIQNNGIKLILNLDGFEWKSNNLDIDINNAIRVCLDSV